MSDRWFATLVRRPYAPIRLLCLPHAGSGAGAYRRWPAAFGSSVEVSALQLPGRESRIHETPAVDPAEVADAVRRAADRPYALFGHSMGARLGFEVTRRLQDQGGPLPVRLYVSACRPPDAHGLGPYEELVDRDDADLLRGAAAAGGIPSEILASPEMCELILPPLRADLAWLAGLEYRPRPPLPVALVGFAGAGDPMVPPPAMAGWARHGSQFQQHVLPGDHFYVHSAVDALSRLISADLGLMVQVEAR
jgi:surfactin synthase thioesterase subunit